MTDPDPVFSRLSRLPVAAPSPELSERVRRAAHARLRPRPLHPALAVAVALSVVAYVGWALEFSAALHEVTAERPRDGERANDH